MIILENEQLTVKIAEFGAEINSVIDRKTNYEFIWQADDTYWGRHAPVLFPIVGRLKEDQYEYNEKAYHMTQHGFARDSEFEMVESSQNSAIFSLRSTEETLKVYPFEFEFLIEYSLQGSEITVSYKVINLSTSKIMYYSVGGHPAFNVLQTSKPAGEKEFDRVSYHFEPSEDHIHIPLTSEGLLDTQNNHEVIVDEVELTHDSFVDDAHIYQIREDTEIILNDRANLVEIRLQAKNMNYVGIWSPYPARGGFVCLEPWAGVADEKHSNGQFAEKIGINQLEPTADATHEYTITFTKQPEL